MNTLTVVGLGPGRPGLITREVWDLLESGASLILRTKIHPTVAALDEAGITYDSYDGFYEEADSFEALYQAIAKDLFQRTEKGSLVYAVPGSPLVAERTVVLLRELKSPAVNLRILPAMSFMEVLCAQLAVDPVTGLTILDAETAADFFDNLKEPVNHPIVLTQVYSKLIASNLKLTLMDHYGDDYEVVYLHNLALEDESIRKIPLYELDRQEDIDHLTTLFIPVN